MYLTLLRLVSFLAFEFIAWFDIQIINRMIGIHVLTFYLCKLSYNRLGRKFVMESGKCGVEVENVLFTKNNHAYKSFNHREAWMVQGVTVL